MSQIIHQTMINNDPCSAITMNNFEKLRDSLYALIMNTLIDILFILLTILTVYFIFNLSPLKTFVVSLVSFILSGLVSFFLIFSILKNILATIDPNTFVSKLIIGMSGGILNALITYLIVSLGLKIKVSKNQVFDLFVANVVLAISFALIKQYIKL